MRVGPFCVGVLLRGWIRGHALRVVHGLIRGLWLAVLPVHAAAAADADAAATGRGHRREEESAQALWHPAGLTNDGQRGEQRQRARVASASLP